MSNHTTTKNLPPMRPEVRTKLAVLCVCLLAIIITILVPEIPEESLWAGIAIGASMTVLLWRKFDPGKSNIR
jgi:hypothetical protein